MVREMNEKYRYKFSVIMPLYNVEEFFEEAIESVIHQTIGFEENIQVILVNDESPDNIEELCMKYTERYPANISYVKKENGGVSSARNEGMKYIKGKYVNFFDPDDRWDESAFAKAFTFLEKHEDVDVVSCRHCFLEEEKVFCIRLIINIMRSKLLILTRIFHIFKWRLMMCSSDQMH